MRMLLTVGSILRVEARSALTPDPSPDFVAGEGRNSWSAWRRIATKRFACGVGLVLVASFALGACGGDDDDGDVPATAAPTNAGGIPANLTKVAISDNKFTPTNLQIPVGANVTWEWSGSSPHSVTGNFDGTEVSSPTLTGTGAFLFAFPKAGKFDYKCGIHGDAMKGTITIQ